MGKQAGKQAVSVQHEKANGSTPAAIGAHGRDSHFSLGKTGGMEYMEEKGFYFVLLSLCIRLNSAPFLDEWCCVSCLSLSLNKAGSVRNTQLSLEATKGFYFFVVCLPCCEAYGILVPTPGIQPKPHALEVWGFIKTTGPQGYSQLRASE